MSEELIKRQEELRGKFESVLEFVTGEEAQNTTADQMERGLFGLLLQLGADLLLLYFQMRAQASERGPVMQAGGQDLPYHAEKKRTYFSIFGKVPVWRPYFYKTGAGGKSPLDEELSLGSDSYSDLLRETLEYVGVYVAYSKACDMHKRLLGVRISTRVHQKMVSEDAADVLAYYAQKPAPDPAQEAEILVIQADGKGIPMILEEATKASLRLGKGEKRGRKKEALVTSVYTIAPARRTPEAVVSSFFRQNEGNERKKAYPKAQNKHVWATLDGKDAALTRLAQQVEGRSGDHIQHKVALADGCQALQQRLETTFPDYTLILDFIHANEYLWKVANRLLGEANDQRLKWVTDKTLLMLSSKTEQLIVDFRSLAEEPGRSKTQGDALTKTANYFDRNLAYMDYATYLAHGWPIASGVIEGACRHFVKDRFELSGMRWHQAGAECLLRLRALAENDDWEAYHLFRRQQRHLRLYDTPLPDRAHLEILSLELHTSFDAQQTMSEEQPPMSTQHLALPMVA